MKQLLGATICALWVVLLCAWPSGCAKRQSAPTAAVATEEDAPAEVEWEEVFLTPGPPPVVATVREQGWLAREREKQRVLAALREQAAKSTPDDPQGLSEAEIKELAERDTIEFH